MPVIHWKTPYNILSVSGCGAVTDITVNSMHPTKKKPDKHRLAWQMVNSPFLQCMLHIILAFLWYFRKQFLSLMQIAHCIVKQGRVRAVPSRAYWTGISVLPENWLSSAGTGVEPTTWQDQCPVSPHQLPLSMHEGPDSALLLLLVLPCVVHHRAVWGVSPQPSAQMGVKLKPSNPSDNDNEPWS